MPHFWQNIYVGILVAVIFYDPENLIEWQARSLFPYLSIIYAGVPSGFLSQVWKDTSAGAVNVEAGNALSVHTIESGSKSLYEIGCIIRREGWTGQEDGVE